MPHKARRERHRNTRCRSGSRLPTREEPAKELTQASNCARPGRNYDLAAAPFLATTSLHLLFKDRAMRAATVCALRVRSTARTRLMYKLLLKTGRFKRRSSKSRFLNSFRNHAQNISIGFKSGERAGIDQEWKPQKFLSGAHTRLLERITT